MATLKLLIWISRRLIGCFIVMLSGEDIFSAFVVCYENIYFFVHVSVLRILKSRFPRGVSINFLGETVPFPVILKNFVLTKISTSHVSRYPMSQSIYSCVASGARANTQSAD